MDEELPDVSVAVMGNSEDVACCRVPAVTLQASCCAIMQYWQCVLEGKNYPISPFCTISWTYRATRKWIKAGKWQRATGWDSYTVCQEGLPWHSLTQNDFASIPEKHRPVGQTF